MQAEADDILRDTLHCYEHAQSRKVR